jgi:hypothetical protein
VSLDESTASRILRIRRWILGLTALAGAALLAARLPFWGWGVLLGGGLAFLNLWGTELAASRLAGKSYAAPALVAVSLAKLGLTGGVIALALLNRAVSPYGLLLGLTSLPLAAVADFLARPALDTDRKE